MHLKEFQGLLVSIETHIVALLMEQRASDPIKFLTPLYYRQGPDQHVQFFYERSHFIAPRNVHANFSIYFLVIFEN